MLKVFNKPEWALWREQRLLAQLSKHELDKFSLNINVHDLIKAKLEDTGLVIEVPRELLIA